jgi:hypothetical protein
LKEGEADVHNNHEVRGAELPQQQQQQQQQQQHNNNQWAAK